MRFETAFLVAIFGLTAALPLDDEIARTIEVARNNEFEQIILDLAEELREIIINGFGDIPVLDPLKVDAIDLDLHQLLGLPNSHIAVRTATVYQLSTFVLDTVSVQMTSLIPTRYTVIIEGHIPALDAHAELYDLYVEIFGANVFGSGDAKAKMIEPRVIANVVVGPKFGWLQVFLEIFSTHIQFKLPEFEPELSGMFGDEFLSDFVNLFLKDLIPELVTYFEPEITEFISTLVFEVGNEILSDLNLIDIIGIQRLSQIFDVPAVWNDFAAKPEVGL